MNFRGRSEDFATLLYMVPFIASGIYGLALWIQSGISLVLPTSVYLTVTRDPILFIIGSLSVMLGIVIELNGTTPAARHAKLASLGNTLQSIAVTSLVLVLICALYANGFTNLGDTVTDFIVGRYGLVFPAMLVLLSYLVTAQFRLEAIANRKVMAVVALLLVPASLYEIGKRQTALGLGIALLFLLIGLALYLVPERKPPAPKEE
jgi:FlaA1/EpsC-like NDP-sugar epimerase